MADGTLRDRLAALAAADPGLAEAVALRGTVIELIGHAEVAIGELRAPADLVRARLAAGVPLLDRLELPCPPAVAALVERLAVAMLADPALRDGAEALLRAVRDRRLHVEQLVGEAVVGHDDHLAVLARSAAVSPAVAEPVADLAARPLLAAVARRLAPALGLGAWTRGYCPLCGGRPVLAEGAASGGDAADRPGAGESAGVGRPADTATDGPPAPSSSAARLRCARCTTGWSWPLPACPACGDGVLAPVAEPAGVAADGWRLLGCGTCRAGLKLADGPRGAALAQLLLDDLATWRLDRAGLAAGLVRPSGLGRRLEHADLPMSEHDDD